MVAGFLARSGNIAKTFPGFPSGSCYLFVLHTVAEAASFDDFPITFGLSTIKSRFLFFPLPEKVKSFLKTGFQKRLDQVLGDRC